MEIEEKLILESIEKNKLIKAINEKRIINIYYIGDETQSRGWRAIEPFCYGINKYGNEVLRAWQESGVSDSYPPGKTDDPLTHVPGWRMFRIDGIQEYIISRNTFKQPRTKYNPKDKDMVTIFAAADFGGTNQGNQQPVEPIKPLPKPVAKITKPQQIKVQPKQVIQKPAPVVNKQNTTTANNPVVNKPVKPQIITPKKDLKQVLPIPKTKNQVNKQNHLKKVSDKFKKLINYKK